MATRFNPSHYSKANGCIAMPGDYAGPDYAGSEECGGYAQFMGYCDPGGGKITSRTGETTSAGQVQHQQVAASQAAAALSVPEAPSGGWSTIRKGASGSAVQALQALLAQKGYSISSVETNVKAWGIGTEAAVRAFQEAKGLTVDGIVGRNTWTALGASYAAPVVAAARPVVAAAQWIAEKATGTPQAVAELAATRTGFFAQNPWALPVVIATGFLLISTVVIVLKD